MIEELSITITKFEYCKKHVLVDATTSKGDTVRLKIKWDDLNWIMGKKGD